MNTIDSLDANLFFLKVELISARSPPSIIVIYNPLQILEVPKLKRARLVNCLLLPSADQCLELQHLISTDKIHTFLAVFLAPSFTGTGSNKVTKCQENINL